MPFEFFKKGMYRPREKEALVEITPKGRIRFNKLAAKLVGNTQHAFLAFDRTKNEVGVFPADQSDESTFPVKPVAKGSKRSIPAKAFFNRFRIEIPSAGLGQLKPFRREDAATGKTAIVIPLDGKGEADQ